MNARSRTSWRIALAQRLPSTDVLSGHPWVRRWLGFILHRDCWVLRRRTVALGAAVGAVVCALPLPGQAFIAAALAGALRANVPVAIAISWLSNPFTVAPIIGAALYIGAWVMGQPLPDLNVLFHPGERTVAAVLEWLEALWQPLAVGVVVLAIVLGVAAYAAVTMSWRGWILWTRRRRRRLHQSTVQSRRNVP